MSEDGVLLPEYWIENYSEVSVFQYPKRTMSFPFAFMECWSTNPFPNVKPLQRNRALTMNSNKKLGCNLHWDPIYMQQWITRSQKLCGKEKDTSNFLSNITNGFFPRAKQIITSKKKKKKTVQKVMTYGWMLLNLQFEASLP